MSANGRGCLEGNLAGKPEVSDSFSAPGSQSTIPKETGMEGHGGDSP
jgi:hypothetical protein